MAFESAENTQLCCILHTTFSLMLLNANEEQLMVAPLNFPDSNPHSLTPELHKAYRLHCGCRCPQVKEERHVGVYPVAVTDNKYSG